MLLALLILVVTGKPADDPAALWRDAKTFLANHRYADARRVLDEAVKASPKDGAFWFYLGVSCAELQDVEGAIHALEAARTLSPQRAEIHFSLGVEYWRRGDLGKAKAAYVAGLALNPKEPRALQNYALLLMKTGAHEKAIGPLLLLKDDTELTLPARTGLIECYLKTGDQVSADRETNEVLQTGIATPEDETKLAAMLIQAKDLKVAEKVLRASLSQRPDQAKAHAALGAIFIEEKRYEEGAQSLERAIRLEPDSAEYAMAFAESLLVWNKESVLLRFLKDVEPKFGKMPEYQYKLALGYYGANKFPETITTLNNLLQMNPRRKDQIYYVLGNSYLTVGNFGDAEKAYQKAIELNPKDAAYYEALATLLRKEGPERLEEAITQLKRALPFGTTDAGLPLQLALCYESKGDLPAALEMAQEAVRRKQKLLPAHVALARLYFRQGRKADGEKEKQLITGLEEDQQQRQLLRAAPGSLERVTARAQ